MSSEAKDDGPAQPNAAAPTPQPPTVRETLRDLWRGIVSLWWGFFDWLAIVSWKTLLIIYGLGLLLAAMLNRPHPFFLFLVVSAIIKIVAGGKRRADLAARQATQRAEKTACPSLRLSGSLKTASKDSSVGPFFVSPLR